jgi:addiction module HigA family antidote
MIINYHDSRAGITEEFLANIHPGNILRLDYLPRMGVTEYRFAKLLGITQSHLAELLAGRRGVTPNLSLRLGKLFGQTPGYWLNIQSQHDLLKAFRDYGESIDTIQTFVWPEGHPFPDDQAF